jgi:Ribbon-helix-helix protein, copG family.
MASQTIRVSLSEIALEKLDELCQQKGVKRGAIIAIAIDLMTQEEENRRK